MKLKKRGFRKCNKDILIADRTDMVNKYESVQKGVGDMMGGALIETEARNILKQGIKQGKSQGVNETKKNMALMMLQDGELPIDKIAKYSGLRVEEVEELASDLQLA